MASTKKTVLILGAGLCSPPVIKYLDQHNYHVIVGNRTKEHAEKITKSLKNAEAIELDIEKPEGVKLLEEITPKVDAIVSMLPYLFHAVAAKIAVANKKHFFTTSYVSDAMKQFDEPAKQAGVVLINECGVDPGTDHMSAMRTIDKVRKEGGKITSFTSFCGGLPAPANNDNPFGYKLSWAPRGVLLASRNDALYLKDGADVKIQGKDLFDNYVVQDIEGLGKFEAYPNRNSKQYIDIYKLPETKTMLRGTFRNIGWCSTIKKIADLGYLNIDNNSSLEGKSYSQITGQLIQSDATGDALKQKVADHLKISVTDAIIGRMEWLGLFDSNKKVGHVATYLDALCDLCKEKLVYKEGEVDMLLMRHEFTAEYSDRTEYLSTTLIDYGIKGGDSSMSRTVSIPVAIAVRMVLEGRVKLTGIQTPVIPELYNPILD